LDLLHLGLRNPSLVKPVPRSVLGGLRWTDELGLGYVEGRHKDLFLIPDDDGNTPAVIPDYLFWATNDIVSVWGDCIDLAEGRPPRSVGDLILATDGKDDG
jgi:hypothetical protein